MPQKKRGKRRLPSSNGSSVEAESDRRVSDQELYAFGLRALSRRPYSTAELKKKLLDRSGDEAAVITVIQRLTASGYLNDRRYIELFAHSHRNRKLHGRFRIDNELRAKQMDPKLIKEVLEEVYPQAEESEQLARALDKKLKSLSPPMDAKKIARLYNYLISHGFPREAIRHEISKRFKHHFEWEK